MDILVFCAITSFYFVIHYLMTHEYRQNFFLIPSILRFNIMMLISFYYLKMASDLIFNKKQYYQFKRLMFSIYFIFMSALITMYVFVATDLSSGNLQLNNICIHKSYLAYKFSELLCALIFFIVVVLMNIKVEMAFLKKLQRVNFEEIHFKERIMSTIDSKEFGSLSSNKKKSSNSISSYPGDENTPNQ